VPSLSCTFLSVCAGDNACATDDRDRWSAWGNGRGWLRERTRCPTRHAIQRMVPRIPEYAVDCWTRRAGDFEAAKHGVQSAGTLPYSDKGVGVDTVARSESCTLPR
jgi:hypothetical protein